MPCSSRHSRNCLASSALLMSLFGTKWSGVTRIFVGSKTLSMPSFLSICTAGGVVTSCATIRSIFALTISPGATESRPLCAARIFSVIVIPIIIPRKINHEERKKGRKNLPALRFFVVDFHFFSRVARCDMNDSSRKRRSISPNRRRHLLAGRRLLPLLRVERLVDGVQVGARAGVDDVGAGGLAGVGDAVEFDVDEDLADGVGAARDRTHGVIDQAAVQSGDLVNRLVDGV